MGRPRNPEALSPAQRQAAWRAKSRVTETQGVTETVTETQSVRPTGFVRFAHQSHVPLSLFDGVGRGSQRTHNDGRRYVLVSRHEGPHLGELGIVSAADWHARLGQRCEHGHAGWSCHTC